MSRWLLLTAFSMACGLVGCAPSSIRPGLANVPRLGGTAADDERVRDVVANGDDSCSAHAEQGPLRYRWPPCTSSAHPIADTELLPAYIGLRESLVMPWLEHFYVGWPCPHALSRTPARTDVRTQTTAATTIAWIPPPAHAQSCENR
jgi:hypothetical protein